VPDFELIASTLRGGLAIDEIRFEVEGAAPASGYLLGRRNEGPQPVVLAVHHERGDKATLLPDLENLAGRGFLCLSIDSPVTRRASAARDPLAAFTSQFAIARAGLSILQEIDDAIAQRTSLLGRGIGGEVAAHLAAHTGRAQVVVAVDALPDRSAFVEHSSHALAAGMRLFHDAAEVAHQVDELRPRRLLGQLEQAPGTHWLLQVATDDDRFSEQDRSAMALSIPRTVRVEHIALGHDLWTVKARRARVEFISKLCG